MIVEAMSIVESGRRKRRFRATFLTLILIAIAALLCVAMLLMGNTIYPLEVVIRVLQGDHVEGASFAIMTLRLPRMLAGLLAGFAFGMSGSVFQTMLRNPLASPNVIGITAGSSAAAVFCILILNLSGAAVSAAAVCAGLATTLLIYALSQGGGFSGGKLILIGIGIQAMLNALISFMLLKAASFDVPTALRWLNGSLNAMQMNELVPLVIALLICSPIVLIFGRRLNILELGDQCAVSLGVPVNVTRIVLILSSVCLLAFATATTGPIAFVAFLAGPIAKRLIGAGLPSEFAAGLVGAVLVLAADLIGQFAFPIRYPVGVITGIIGAPYLLYLLIRTYRSGAAR